MSSQANLLGWLDRMREDHSNYISSLSSACNEVPLKLKPREQQYFWGHVSISWEYFLQVITIQRDSARPDNENADLYDLALRGLQLLAQWNSKVMELVSDAKHYVNDIQIHIQEFNETLLVFLEATSPNRPQNESELSNHCWRIRAGEKIVR